MITIEFLLSSLIVVLIPGTGVIYTISIGLFKSSISSIYAAFGCTLGIVPHILMSMLTISLLLNVNDVLFNIIKYIGIIYILYLSWLLWNDEGVMSFKSKYKTDKKTEIVLKGFLINILNPKLTLFLVSFLPQFIKEDTDNIINDILLLSSIFMIMTLIVFILYGVFADYIRKRLLNTNRQITTLQRVFSITFVLLCVVLIN